jgi:hypothetical protein
MFNLNWKKNLDALIYKFPFLKYMADYLYAYQEVFNAKAFKEDILFELESCEKTIENINAILIKYKKKLEEENSIDMQNIKMADTLEDNMIPAIIAFCDELDILPRLDYAIKQYLKQKIQKELHYVE